MPPTPAAGPGPRSCPCGASARERGPRRRASNPRPPWWTGAHPREGRHNRGDGAGSSRAEAAHLGGARSLSSMLRGSPTAKVHIALLQPRHVIQRDGAVGPPNPGLRGVVTMRSGSATAKPVRTVPWSMARVERLRVLTRSAAFREPGVPPARAPGRSRGSPPGAASPGARPPGSRRRSGPRARARRRERCCWRHPDRELGSAAPAVARGVGLHQAPSAREFQAPTSLQK